MMDLDNIQDSIQVKVEVDFLTTSNIKRGG